MIQRFVRRMVTSQLRYVFRKHGLKIILVLLLAVAALLVLNLQAQAAGPEPDTQALNEVAAAISENAQVIQDYVDSIDVAEIRGIMDDMSEYVNAPLAGAPTIVIVVLGFVMIMMVVRKVIGR